MKKILVPTDFSDNALKAALYAAEIAKKSGAVVHLVHALELGHEKVYEPFSLHEKYNNLVFDDRMKELSAMQESMSAVYPEVKTESELVDGAVTDIIPEYCRNKGIDLVVMGTRGASGAKEIFMGSVTAGTIGKTRVPVLAVPEEYIIEEPDAIMLACNHFEKDTDKLDMLLSLARLFSASVHVVVYVDKNHADAGEYIINGRKLEQYLKFLQSHFSGISFHGRLIEGTNFEAALELYNLEHEVDMLAMITYPKSFLDKLLRKSATKKMAFHSRIPLLAIPV